MTARPQSRMILRMAGANPDPAVFCPVNGYFSQEYIDQYYVLITASGFYGLLYNKQVLTDSRKLTSSDNWNPMTRAEYDALKTFIGTSNPALYLSALDNGTNNFGLNMRLGGYRRSTGAFEYINGRFFGITTTNASTFLYHFVVYYTYVNTTYLTYTTDYSAGSVRLKKNSTLLSDGESGLYFGNDGRVYRTICINGIEYLADNLLETRFRNLDIIPWHGADPASFYTTAEWAVLTGPGCCAYNNDKSKVAPNFAFP